MSTTSSVAPPGSGPDRPARVGPGSARDRTIGLAPRGVRALMTGRPEDPWWSRPGLIAVAVVTGLLVFWGLSANGYANNWYAGGALAASRSWKALLDNAADLSGVVSLDKGPLSDWMIGLSGWILGFSPFSMLLPDALCGVASVIVLHDTVRRTLGLSAAENPR